MAQTLKPELRQQILESATRHFTTRGLQKTTMRLISKDAGTSAGNLYRYVPSKDALYEELTRSAFERLERLAERLENHRSDRIALEEFDAFLRIREEEATGLAILFANRGEEPMRYLIDRFEGVLSTQLSTRLVNRDAGEAVLLGQAMARGVLAALFHLLTAAPDVPADALRDLITLMLTGRPADFGEGEVHPI